MKAVIMAGGTGTRLWPVSRQNTPKQVHPFGDRQTLLQKTYRRLRRGWPDRDIVVSTNNGQLTAVRQQLGRLPRSRFIVEPVRRDTAAAIGLIASYLWKKNPKEAMFTASSDHYFREEKEYIRAIKAAGKLVFRYPQRTLLFGIKPRYAHTGLGYIMMKRQVDTVDGHDVFSVNRFIEKPNLPTAGRFMTRWEYLWNIGSFMFRVDAMLDKFRRWLPRSHRLLMTMAESFGTSRETATVKRLFPKMDQIAIDYGIMEKDKQMLVLPLDLTWADIGSWREVFDMLADHPQANVVRGRHVTHDAHGNLLLSYSGKLIAAAGLKQMIVVETPDAILICPKDRAQDVKQLVSQLAQRNLHRYL